MISESVKGRMETAIESIRESRDLDANEKLFLTDLITQSASGTNGLTPEEKLQSVSETVFHLALIQVMERLEQGGRKGIYDALKVCRWAIVAVVGIVAALLLFRPELSAAIMALVG